MTLLQLLEQARIELDDTEQDYLWGDAELKLYINEAEKEACRRSRLIVDSSTASVCQITVTANDSEYDLSSKIVRVLDVLPSWDNRVLKSITMQELNLQEPSWRTRTSAKPDYFIRDWQTNAIKLFPTPTVSGTLNLRVQRIPLEAMADDADVPEINEKYHEKLVYWVKHRAYMKKDADTLDKNASLEALAMFEAEFGPARPAWAVEFDNQYMPNDLYTGA